MCGACAKHSEPFGLGQRVFQVARYAVLALFSLGVPMAPLVLTASEGGLSFTEVPSLEVVASVIALLALSSLGVGWSVRGVLRAFKAGPIIALSARDRTRL